MNMTDLWAEVSRDDEAERTQRYLLAARVRTSHLVPLLAQATSAADYTNRLALVADRMESAVAEAVGEDYDYYGRTHAALLAELREDWETVRSAAKGPAGHWCRFCGQYQSVRTPAEAAKAQRHHQEHLDRGDQPKPKKASNQSGGSIGKVANWYEEGVVGKQPLGFPGAKVVSVEPTSDYLMNGPVGDGWYDRDEDRYVTTDFIVTIEFPDGRTAQLPKSYDWLVKTQRNGKTVTGSRKTAYTKRQHDELTRTYFNLTGSHLLADHRPEMVAVALDNMDIVGAAVALAGKAGHVVSMMDGMLAHDKALQAMGSRHPFGEGGSAVASGLPRVAALTCPKCGADVSGTAKQYSGGNILYLEATCPSCGWKGTKRRPASDSKTAASERAYTGLQPNSWYVTDRAGSISAGPHPSQEAARQTFALGPEYARVFQTDGEGNGTVTGVDTGKNVWYSSKTASFAFALVSDADISKFVELASQAGYNLSPDAAHDVLLLNGGYERAMEIAGIRSDAYGYEPGFGISELIETTDAAVMFFGGASEADAQKVLKALRTEPQRQSVRWYLEHPIAEARKVGALVSKVALDRGEDGHEHRLKHLYVDLGGNDNVTFAECEICGEVFVASREYTDGEFVPRVPVAASKVASDPDDAEWNARYWSDRARHQENINAAVAEMLAMKGKVVTVVKGRKVPIGTRGTVFYVGEGNWGWRVGFTDHEGVDHWTDARNVEVLAGVTSSKMAADYTRDPYRGGDGQMYAVHTTGPNDSSPVHDMSDYDARCGWCYLNASHSDDAHAEGIAKGVEPSLDPQGLVASFSAGYEAGWTAARVARVRTAALNETLEDTGYAKGVAAYWKAAAVGFEEYTPWAREYIDAWNAVYRQALQDGKSHAEAVDEADRVNGEPILAAAKKDDDKDKKPEDEDENSGWDDLNEGRYGSRKTAESNPYDGDSGSNPFAVDRPAAPAPKGPGTPDDALDGPATPEPVRVPTTTRPRGGEQIDMTPPPPAQPMMVTPVDPNQQVAAAKIDLQDPAVRSKILAIARSVTETNSGISWQEARDVAVRTVKAFPRMVQR